MSIHAPLSLSKTQDNIYFLAKRNSIFNITIIFIKH